MRYATVIEETSDGGCGAYVPDLPGRVAVAATLDETRKLIHEAVEFHLEAMRAHGDPIPEPSAISEYVETSKSSDAA
jgi:predicted RNase H-like HicB family nuclease